MTTIRTKFDVTTLPEWAQRDLAIVDRCESDLGFRATVCTVQPGNPGFLQSVHSLKRQTQRLQEERDNL